MSNFSPYSDHGYFALIKEAAAGTPLTPTSYMGFQSESLMPSFGIKPIQSIAGDRARHVRSVPNKVEVSGDLEFYVEPKMIGHFLRALFGAPTTQTLVASEAYRHVFEVTDTPRTYTFDIQPADAPWVHRFYGVQVNKLAFSQDDNVLKCTAGLTPRKAFINARILTAANSGTAVALDQTAGLVAGDSILIIQNEDGYTTVQDRVIASITDDNNLVVTEALNAQIDVDDIVVIKRATATYDQDLELTWLGGGAFYSGDDVDNVTAEDKEDFGLEFANEVEQRWFGGLEESDRYPGDVLTKGFIGSGKVSKFYDSESNLDKVRKNAKFGGRFLFQGETDLGVNSAVKASNSYGSGNGFSITATTAGKAGNDYNVTIVINDSDDLAASISGKNILIELANTTASKNTGTLIAAAVNALSGVDGAAVGAGTDQFTTAEANENLGFRTPASDTVGRDANEHSYLQFDMADLRLDAFFPNESEDENLMEEVPFTMYKDTRSGDQKKNWTSRVFLVNSVTSY